LPVVMADDHCTRPAVPRWASGTQTVTATASDNVGVTMVKTAVNNQVFCQQTAPPFSCPVTLSGSLATIDVWAYDAAGNSRMAEVNVKVAAGGSTSTSSPTTPQNLSQNPGFETGESPWLQWWDSSVATNHFARNDRGPHTGTYKADHWDPNGAALAQYTYQVVTGVPNGLYTLRAWVRSSGGLQQLYLGAKNFGGTEMKVSLPVAAPISTYTLYQLNHIPVTAGKIEVYFWTKAPAGQWLWSTWDDLVLVKE